MKDETNVKRDERELIEAVQVDLARAKDALRDAERKMRKVQEVNREDGRTAAMNACLKFRGVLQSCLGQLNIGHADASDALVQNWPKEGGEITTMGGGGR